MTGHANAVDGVDSHLVRHPFDHSLGFIGGVGVGVKVQPHPAVAFRLLPLQHVTCAARCEEEGVRDSLFFFFFYRLINSLFITDDGLSAVKLWRVPLDNTGVLPHAEDFNCLGGIWDIWGGGKM